MRALISEGCGWREGLRYSVEMGEGGFDADGCVRLHLAFPYPQIFGKGPNNKEMKTSKPER